MQKDQALSLDFKWIENNIKFHLNLRIIILGRPQAVATVAAAAPPQRRWGKVVKMHELFSKKNKDKSKNRQVNNNVDLNLSNKNGAVAENKGSFVTHEKVDYKNEHLLRV